MNALDEMRKHQAEVSNLLDTHRRVDYLTMDQEGIMELLQIVDLMSLSFYLASICRNPKPLEAKVLARWLQEQATTIANTEAAQRAKLPTPVAGNGQ